MKFRLTLLIGLLFVAGGAMAQIKTVKASEFEKVMQKKNVRVVDVRTLEEFESGHIIGAQNIDWKSPDFAKQFKAAVPRSQTVALYCRSGKRSKSAAEQLLKMGYKVVYNLDGGILNWQLALKPVMIEK